jgi:hypothetical protein
MSPCHDSRDEEDRRAMKGRLDLATRLLCDLCKSIDGTGMMKQTDPELQEWWADHQRHDAKFAGEL